MIGNHPDEITAHIPLMAAVDSYPFLIIPCCAYSWEGTYERKKIKGKKEAGSTYENFIQATCSIATTCGFNCTLDRLRIPSTKKTAIIGYPKPGLSMTESGARLKLLIEHKRFQNTSSITVAKHTVEKAMAIKNCTSLPKPEIEAIIKEIFSYLLDTALVPDKNYVHDNGRPWNRGNQTLCLTDIVKFLGRHKLELLKGQNKGLQTLLRNHKRIFSLEDGAVRLRIPRSADKIRIKKTHPSVLKKKLCYFDMYHPNSCPLMSEECSYSHQSDGNYEEETDEDIMFKIRRLTLDEWSD